MAESNGQEKTEQPTGKRRSDARKEGNLFQSKDVATVVVLFCTFWAMRLALSSLYRTLRDYLVRLFGGLGGDLSEFLSASFYSFTVMSFLKCVLPLLLVTMVCGILAAGVQTRFNVTFKPLKPKLSKLNPISGLKKLFSLRNVVELVKNLLKITVLLAVVYNLLKGEIRPLARLMNMAPLHAAVYTLNLIFSLAMKVCLAFAIVAFFDFLYQRWDYEKNLKMTKQEVKEEYKQMEGNPEIKGRIRKAQRQMAQSRMMQKVPEADVIIRNPTHFAVALKYDPDCNGAPVVVAKGQDELALRIVKIGEENDVFILENRPLARALYASCEIDREIPAEFYAAVAEILVYIYKAGNREDMFR